MFGAVKLTAVVLVAACGTPVASQRDAFVIDTLAEDNYAWALREPDTVAMKLKKMQREPFLWLRGTPAVYWRDLTSVGAVRPATAYGDPASSRVLLVADPHPENIGSFRAPDGTIVVDWNDFDSAGYGPFEGDVRRLAAGLIVAAGDATLGDTLAHHVGTAYAAEIAQLAQGAAPVAVTTGAAPYLDKLIAKAAANGDARKDLADDVVNGAFVSGDLDPVAADGVIETRLLPLGGDERDRVRRAMATVLAHHPELGTIVDIARRYGSGVSSYAALRYYVLVSSERILEVKEERDGLAIHGVPQLQAAEWRSPAARCVDAQRRLQVRPDLDDVLDVGELAPLTFKVRDARYQRGVDAGDLGKLATDKPDQLVGLADVFGTLLARAHGVALTADGVPGWTVIAPLLDAGFADEVATFADADAAQVIADWTDLANVDLAARVLPAVRE
jgi:uncharacterized protein (DUF2252 family)